MKISLAGILPNSNTYSPESIEESLRDSKFKGHFEILKVDQEEGKLDFAMEVKVNGNDYLLTFIKNIFPISSEFIWKELTEDEIAEAKVSKQSLILQRDIDQVDKLGTDFLEAVSLITAAAPGMVMLVDQVSYRIHSGDWTRDLLQTGVEPSVERRYTIHAVSGDTTAWLHTHGLPLLGLPEVEMLGVDLAEVQSYGQVFNAVIKRIISEQKLNDGGEIVVGNKLKVSLVKFSKAIKSFRDLELGGKSDRDHNHPTDNFVIMQQSGKGILGGKKFSPISNISQYLSDNPVFFISHAETARMSRMAAAKLSQFKRMFEKFSASEDWKFLVKLGYPMNRGDEEDREHLWFDLKEYLSDKVMKLELINQPYYVDDLNEGDVIEEDDSKLTDLLILSPFGRFSPDEFYDLERKT